MDWMIVFKIEKYIDIKRAMKHLKLEYNFAIIPFIHAARFSEFISICAYRRLESIKMKMKCKSKYFFDKSSAFCRNKISQNVQ